MADAAVIGGNGFIGRYLVSALVEAGHRVRVIGRSVPRAVDARGVEFVRGDVADAASMSQALTGMRYVHHLATGGGARWSDFERDFIHGTENVIRACEANHVERLIFTSTIAALYLGDTGSINESTGTDPKRAERGFYSRAKSEAEAVLAKAAGAGFKAVIVRPGVVLGAGTPLTHSGFGLWMSDLDCVGWGMGNHPLPLVLASDVASAMVAAMTVPGVDGRTYNLAGDVRLTAREFVAEMARRSRRRIRFHARPLSLLQASEIVKWMIKIAARKAENPFPSFRDLKSRSLRTQLDCSAAKHDLGWRPVADREQFLAETIDTGIRPIVAGDLRLDPAQYAAAR